MTILKTMTSFAIDKKLLSVNEDHLNFGERCRTRSERASSLALPHSSLLDFYDKQQEECNSVALLPSNINVVVRRHSSHYYPMLEDKQQQQIPAAAAILKSTCSASANQLIIDDATLMPTKNTLNQQTEIKNKFIIIPRPAASAQAASCTQAAAIAKNPATATVASNSPPPPPIPKRTFRGKCVWNPNAISSGNSSPTAMTTMQSPTKGKQQQQQQQQQLASSNSIFVYPTQQQSQQAQGNYYNHQQQHTTHMDNNMLLSQGMYNDMPTPRSLYADCCTDLDGISDDDRMSLENSVFDESLTSTPVKMAAAAGNAAGTVIGGTAASHSVGGGKLANKTLAALANELSHAAKRNNRSSCSTVDSSTTSSGYGTHSERFASTSSTTADIRSRLSSVDTQSSLDSCLVEKSLESPLLKDTVATYKVDMMNSLNNNRSSNAILPQQQQQQQLPAVPQRKPFGSSAAANAAAGKLPAHNQSLQSLTNSSDGGGSGNSTKPPSTVSASTSTSSAASAGSSTLSGSSMSISVAASNTATSPLIHNTPTSPLCQLPLQTAGGANNKRPIPPIPPLRTQLSNDSTSNGITQETAFKLPAMATRNKPTKHRPPPIVYPKLHQRQDSNLSSDSFSVTSSPGYNTKNQMDVPLLQNAGRINKTAHINCDNFGNPIVARFGNMGYPPVAPPPRQKLNYRQDSTISSDSFSQTSSPGYNSKIMEAPLLPSLSAKRLCSVPAPIICKQKFQNEPIEEIEHGVPLSPLTKCVSTPASLQTIVRFQNGAPNTMSLPHQIINRRKSSNPYITNGRLKFRLFQILLNALALLAIAGGLAAYFNAYPQIKFVNKTIINTIHVEDTSSYGKNPAPGTCLPIIVKFCQGPQIPYNYTVFPNYIGHFGQLETQVDLDAYEALVDVRCYELVSLFLCTLFVPKCGSTGATVPPCKTLCTETMRRCGFFFDVFGLTLPEYLNCKLFKDFESADDCVGLDEVRDVMIAATNPKCDGFQCDQNRCIPKDYVCDGHLDCMDQADEAKCERCEKDEIYCGDDKCVTAKHICDGHIDCPYGQDERNCIRLSERNGDLGKGVLEVYRLDGQEFKPACVKNWDRAVSPSVVCSMLGYSSVNATSVLTQKTHRPLLASVNVSTDMWKMYAKKRSNLMEEFSKCNATEDYPIAELTCANYECGKVKRGRHKPSRRIIGGSKAQPGSWPFLAAILGGPEKIFYCAGVLISDQWVLTASHCIGNHTVIDLEDWTIQLGVTRRNSFTYSGQIVKVKTVIPHSQYNTAIAHDNDIALFQLATRVAFHEHLLPVCLPPPNLKQLKPDQMCTVIGWGKREDKDPKSTYEPIVNEVQVPIIKRSQCDEWLDNLTVSEGMICAGYEEGGKDACQGDSGGPLLCPYPNEKDRWFVGGIVSWGIMCAHPKLPGVYANVIKYVPWIQEQIQKYSKSPNDDKVSKYDSHPGGPDILSNMANSPLITQKPIFHQNRSPMYIDNFYSSEKT